MGIVFLFIIMVAINSAAVYVQRRYKLYTRVFGTNDWTAHVILLSIIWTFFILGLIFIKPPVWSLPTALRPFSLLAALVGIYMIATACARLGISGTLNGWFFGRGPKERLKEGIFKLQNPMYTGFFFLFIAAAFWQKNAFYLGIGVLSFLLLNIIQAGIETPKKPSE